MRQPLHARLTVHLLQSEYQREYHTLPVRTPADICHRSANATTNIIHKPSLVYGCQLGPFR
jgi:hypothetical protein